MNVIIDSKPKSMSHTSNAIIMEAIKTTTALLTNSERDGQETLCINSK